MGFVGDANRHDEEAQVRAELLGPVHANKGLLELHFSRLAVSG